MIFLTLGTQLAFDRLVMAVDAVADTLSEEFFGQVGNANYTAKNFPTVQFMEQHEFNKQFEAARVVIAHAGMGTILNAMRHKKPLIIMAREASYGEHRNNHQRGTVEQMRSLPGLYPAESSEDIKKILSLSHLEPMTQSPSPARQRLIKALRNEVFSI